MKYVAYFTLYELQNIIGLKQELMLNKIELLRIY